MAYIQQQQQQQTGNGANAIGADASAVMSAANASCGPNDVQMAADGYETKPNQVHLVTAGVSDDTTDTESNQAHPTSVANATVASGNLQDANDDSDGGGGANGTGRASLSSAGGTGKSPNSYKYPLLRRYFEFGPWVGRNRKALCLGCRQQTSSSQPDRLLRHLNRCNALTDEDKAQVADLMNERTANKRRKPGCSKRATNNDDSEGGYYGGDEDHSGVMDDILNAANTSHGPTLNIPTGNLKRLKRDSDKHSHIDEALTRFIVLCRIPLKVIHSREFVDLTRALNPDYQIPSRETITNVLIPGLLNIL